MKAEQLQAALRRLARSTEPIARYHRFKEAVDTPTSTNPTDAWMTALVLLEDVLQCPCFPWIWAELNQRLEIAGLHHQRGTGGTTPDRLLTAFTPLRLPTQWLTQATTAVDTQLASLIALYPAWPWGDWLTQAGPSSTEDALNRWQQLYAQLRGLPDITTLAITGIRQRLVALLHAAPVPAFTTSPWPRPHWGMIVVEGMSERYVIPAAAKALGLSLAGITIVATGGKGPMVGWTETIREQFNGPLALLLDADGADEAAQLGDRLHANDLVTCLPGTLEDSYPDALVARVINHHYEPVTPMTASSLAKFRKERQLTGNNLALFKALWEFYELTPPEKPGPFEKVSFAANVARHIHTPDDVSPALSSFLQHAVAQIEQHRQAVWAEVLTGDHS